MGKENSEDIKQRIVNKRRCSYTMKRFNIRIFIIAIIILSVWCAVLLERVFILNSTLESMNLQLDTMEEMLLEQQGILGELQHMLNTQTQEDMLIYGREQSSLYDEEDYVVEGMGAKHRVYLTFDDGPSVYTDEILDILDQYNVKATFFVVGREDEASKEALKQIVERGHSLGMHSYSHDYSGIYQSVDTFAEDFTKLQDYLLEVTGVKSTLYRFPGGSSNTISEVNMQQFADYLQEQGVAFFDWNISSGDGASVILPVETLVENCTRDITKWKTSIVLLHDAAEKGTTVEALPGIIENILAMEDTVILPITEETRPVQHINQ